MAHPRTEVIELAQQVEHLMEADDTAAREQSEVQVETIVGLVPLSLAAWSVRAVDRSCRQDDCRGSRTALEVTPRAP
ncbi:MAG: hypothetical protein ABIP45_04680 [Knoellia sp.]